MRQRACHQSRPAIDVAVALSLAGLDTAMTLVGASWWPAHPGPLAWTLLAVQALLALSLVARRRAPLTVIGAFTAFTLTVTLLASPFHALTPAHGGTVYVPFAAALAAYAPVVRCVDRRWAFAAIAALALAGTRPWHPSIPVVTTGLGRTAAGPLVAMYVVARRQLVRALTERAEHAERATHLLAEQARAEERTRLAGEMHDIVTHRVSLMVLQAGALRMTAPDERTRRAAEDLRAAGCRALDELRDLVGILRTSADHDDPPDEPRPSAPDLAALTAESTAVGVPAELVEAGDPALASPVVGRTAYRITQEALTNVRKHAPGARVEVRVRYGTDSVRLTVRNTAPAGEVDRALAASGSGVGIANLRRRVELVHGTLRHGPRPDGGYVVDATLPAYVPTADIPAGREAR